jgi:hypothetical protein
MIQPSSQASTLQHHTEATKTQVILVKISARNSF